MFTGVRDFDPWPCVGVFCFLGQIPRCLLEGPAVSHCRCPFGSPFKAPPKKKSERKKNGLMDVLLTVPHSLSSSSQMWKHCFVPRKGRGLISSNQDVPWQTFREVVGSRGRRGWGGRGRGPSLTGGPGEVDGALGEGADHRDLRNRWIL